jgi:hypothetical protein
MAADIRADSRRPRQHVLPRASHHPGSFEFDPRQASTFHGVKPTLVIICSSKALGIDFRGLYGPALGCERLRGHNRVDA